MQILDDIVRKEIVAKAHKAAHSHLMDALDTNAISADDIQEAIQIIRVGFWNHYPGSLPGSREDRRRRILHLRGY